MKKSLTVLAAVSAASAASAQSLEIEPAVAHLPFFGQVTVTVFADSGPADYAVAGWNGSVVASGTGSAHWSNNMHHIGPAQGGEFSSPGTIEGYSVTGIFLGQGPPALGFTPVPGRVIFWSADFVDDDGGFFEIRTETTRFEVYTEPGAEPPTRRTLVPADGFARVPCTPAPGSLTLLAPAGLAAARRRR